MAKDQQIDVEYVARLARMSLTEEEKKLFSRQMGDIIHHLDKLNELDTTGIEPTSHVIEQKNVFREDKAEASLPREEILAGAPDGTEEYFQVPKVIE